MRHRTFLPLLLGLVIVSTGCAATHREWEVWRAHPTHYATGNHLAFSMQNMVGARPQVTPELMDQAKGEGWWGRNTPFVAPRANVAGTWEGTWIVETTVPSSPVEKGFFPGPFSQWREISTYQHYAYVVTEGGGGVQVIDFANPDAPAFVGTSTVPGWAYTDTVSVDRGVGRLYCNGTESGMRIFDLANPVSPSLLATYAAAYVQDSFRSEERRVGKECRL